MSRSLPARRALFVLALLLLARLFQHALLYRAGFQSLTADEFARVVLAARWAAQPHLVWQGVWLPFHLYLVGGALWLAPNLLWVPRALAMAAGALSLLLMYALTLALFNKQRLALLSAALLALNPVHLWLSSTPLTEIFHTTLVLAGMAAFVRFQRGAARRWLFLAAAALALANGFRFEAWMLSLVWSLYLGAMALHALARRRGAPWRAWLVAAALPWLFPVLWLVGSYVETGSLLTFFSGVKSYKAQWYGAGSDYTRYLTTFLGIDPLATLLLVPALLLALWHARHDAALRWMLAITLLPLGLFGVAHGGQNEPLGNFLRYLAPFLFLFYPLVAALLDAAARALAGRRAQRLVLGLMLVAIAGFQLPRAFAFTNDPAAQGLAVGEHVRALRAASPGEARPLLLELTYWEYLAVYVGANDLRGIVYDRAPDFANRATPSLLLADPRATRACLGTLRVSHVVARSPEVRAAIEAELGLTAGDIVNGFVFYPVPPNAFPPDGTPCPLDG